MTRQPNRRAHFLVSDGVAADLVAGKQRFAAEEGVASALEVQCGRQRFHAETVGGEPGFVHRLFALALWMTKVGNDTAVTMDQGGVRGEDQIGQSRLRRQFANLGARRHEVLPQVLPLTHGQS